MEEIRKEEDTEKIKDPDKWALSLNS